MVNWDMKCKEFARMKSSNFSMRRRFLAIALSLLMIFQMLPAGALGGRRLAEEKL